jgi:hypothetical protein
VTTFAASDAFNGGGSGIHSGSVYQPNGSSIQNSFYGNTDHTFNSPTFPNGFYPTSGAGVPATASPSNGGIFRPNEPVGLTTAFAGSALGGVTETWQIVTGTTQNNHTGHTGTGTSPTDYAGDGEIIFTLTNIFPLLGDPNGNFALLWAMTCANDYVQLSFQLPPQNNQLPTPLPAALPLFASGAGFLSLLGWRRRRNKVLSAQA